MVDMPRGLPAGYDPEKNEVWNLGDRAPGFAVIFVLMAAISGTLANYEEPEVVTTTEKPTFEQIEEKEKAPDEAAKDANEPEVKACVEGVNCDSI